MTDVGGISVHICWDELNDLSICGWDPTRPGGVAMVMGRRMDHVKGHW